MFARGRFCGFFDEVDEGGGRRRHVSSDSHRGPSGNRAVTHAPKAGHCVRCPVGHPRVQARAPDPDFKTCHDSQSLKGHM